MPLKNGSSLDRAMAPVDTSVKDFGHLLRSVRLRRGMPQRDLAQCLGHANQTTVSAWENGHGVPSPKRLRDLINVLTPDASTDARVLLRVWQNARLRLDRHLSSLLEGPELGQCERTGQLTNCDLTLGDVLQREYEDDIAQVWVLASETLQEHGLWIDRLVTLSSRATIVFCLEDELAFALTARPILKYLERWPQYVGEHPGEPTDCRLENIQFAALGPLAVLGFLNQSLTVHVYRTNDRVRAYAGPPHGRIPASPALEVNPLIVGRVWNTLRRRVQVSATLREVGQRLGSAASPE